jgi:chromosome partitioning protein
MLDLRVVPGEYEALAPCLLEETIMRGRRRGRNRPSPQSPPSQESAKAASPSGNVSVTLVDEPRPDEGAHDAAGVTDEDATTGPAADPPGEAADAVESPAAEEPAADTAEAATVDDAAPEPEPAPAQVVTKTVTAEAPPKVRPSEAVVVGSATEDDGPAPSNPGREAQAASGNPLPRVLAVANQKGGVGKTTTSVNLGAALAELGFRVLVIDLDPQGNATTGLGIDARNFELSMYDVLMRDCSLEDCVEPTSMKNLFVAPATIALAGAEIELVPAFSRELKLKRAIESVLDDFDYVLIDCPPSLGLITVNALAAATEVLVPIQCEYYALEGLSQLMRNVHLVASNLNPKLDISTIVLTMYDARTKLADQVATEVRDHFGAKVCRIVIPRTVRLSEAPSFGQPITAFDPASRGAIAYRELAKEVSGGTS